MNFKYEIIEIDNKRYYSSWYPTEDEVDWITIFPEEPPDGMGPVDPEFFDKHGRSLGVVSGDTKDGVSFEIVERSYNEYAQYKDIEKEIEGEFYLSRITSILLEMMVLNIPKENWTPQFQELAGKFQAIKEKVPPLTIGDSI